MINREIEKHLRKLRKMTINRSIIDIKKYLDSLKGTKIKGTVCEYYFRELYDGNGVEAKVVGGKYDGGVDVVLFRDSLQETVSECIQVKNHKQPLDTSKVVAQVANFKYAGQQMYRCADVIRS